MWQDCDQWLKDHQEEMIQSLQELVRVQSVSTPCEKDDEPFGPAIAQAFYKIIELAQDLDLEVRNLDGYDVLVDLGDSGELWGALSHADIVPAGKGWSVPPFTAERKDGKVFGRGTEDDKGPLVAVLYAMAAIKACRMPIKNRFRHIIGGAEETDFRCIHYFKEHMPKEEIPVGGFSPDAAFPLIFAEKGILHFTLRKKWEKDTESDLILMRLSGGERVNMVPSSAEAVFGVTEAGRAYLEEAYFKYADREALLWEEGGGEITIRAKGQNAHACKPDFGVNAIALLMNFLSHLAFRPKAAQEACLALSQFAQGAFTGEGFGIACRDEVSGALTITGNTIAGDGHGLQISYDMRWPVTIPLTEIWPKIEQKAQEAGFTVQQDSQKNPLYLAKDSHLVATLLKVYGDYMGIADPQPIATGGGTYCRALPGFAAFGPVFEGRAELAHQTDEYMGEEEILQLAQIYARAIYALIGV